MVIFGHFSKTLVDLNCETVVQRIGGVRIYKLTDKRQPPRIFPKFEVMLQTRVKTRQMGVNSSEITLNYANHPYYATNLRSPFL